MSGSPDKASDFRPQRTLALTLLSFVSVLSMADRVLLGIVTEPVKRDLMLNDTQMSLVNGFLFVAFNLGAGLFIARWVDRSNRKRILALGLAAWTIATAMTGWAQGFFMLGLSRILVGAGEATVVPVAISIIADLYEPSARPRAVGIFQTSNFFGLVGGSVLAGVLSAMHGWRSMFVIFGIAGLALLLLVLCLLREPARNDSQTSLPPQSRAKLVQSVVAILRIPGFSLLGLGLGCSAMGVTVLAAWAPAFLQRSHGVPLAEVGAVTGPAIGIGGISGTLISGLIASWLVRRSGSDSASLLIPVIALPMAAPCFAAFVLLPSLGGALAAAGVMNFLLSAAVAPCMALSIALVTAWNRGMASTLLLFANGIIAGALAPFLVGTLSDALTPALGDEALRYAILSMAPTPLFAAVLLWIARSRMNARQAVPATCAQKESFNACT
ncbi:MAG: MFS transporter [Sphingobium sp.]|nr:MFS transporter [Sphingobium sp.]